jgi:hypothetical protein
LQKYLLGSVSSHWDIWGTLTKQFSPLADTKTLGVHKARTFGITLIEIEPRTHAIGLSLTWIPRWYENAKRKTKPSDKLCKTSQSHVARNVKIWIKRRCRYVFPVLDLYFVLARINYESYVQFSVHTNLSWSLTTYRLRWILHHIPRKCTWIYTEVEQNWFETWWKWEWVVR